MSFSAKFSKPDAVVNLLAKKIPAQIETKISNELILGAMAIQSTAVKSIANQSGSRQEVRYGPKRTVKVSNPGEPPNADTGRLMQSITFEREDRLTIKVGTNLKYGAYLEYGTTTIDKRPWLRPAYLKEEKKIRAAIAKALKGLAE